MQNRSPTLYMDNPSTPAVDTNHLIELLEQILTRLPAVNQPRIYTAEETAQILKTSRGDIYALIRSGRLKSFRHPRVKQRNLIPEESIREYINNQIESCMSGG